MQIDEWTGYVIEERTLNEAAQWIAELDKHKNDDSELDYTATRQLAFYDWLGKDPSHQQAYAELSEVWARCACICSMTSALKSSQVIQFPSSKLVVDDIALFPESNAPKNLFDSQSYAPAWAYSASLALIVMGLVLPIFQSII